MKWQLACLSLLISFFFRLPSAQAIQCRTLGRVGTEQASRFAERQSCRVNSGKDVHVLRLRGTLAEMSEDQGYLMAKEAVEGPMRTAIGLAELRLSQTKNSGLVRAVYRCVSNYIWGSVSDEFNSANLALVRGAERAYAEKGIQFPFSRDQLRLASVAIDASIVLEGIRQRMDELEQMDLITRQFARTALIAELLDCPAQAGLHGAGAILDGLGDAFRGAPASPKGLGCTGFVTPGSLTEQGSLIHGRNLDGELIEAFAKNPTLFVMEEKGQIPLGPRQGQPFFKYVAAATPGLVFPGGISGFNEKGISVSLHEMQTVKYRMRQNPQAGAVGPFIQQRILRETASIQEALKLVEDVGRYGAWSILISDSKTNESATIEFSGDRVRLTNHVVNQTRAQTNHFLDPDMQSQFYNYNYGKFLETRARYDVVESLLSQVSPQKRMSIQGAVNLLSDHHDGYVEGGDLRSFGRTVVKAYNSLSTLAVPAQGEMWFSAGDRYPVAHGTFAGFRVSFPTLSVQPIGEVRTNQYLSLAKWEKSLGAYTESRIEHEQGRTANAVALLEQAIALAGQDGRYESNYRFVKARVLHEMGAKEPTYFQEAMRTWNELQSHRMDEDQLGYQAALLDLYSVVTSDELQKRNLPGALGSADRAARLQLADQTMRRLNQQSPHFDLQAKMKLIHQLQAAIGASDLPEIDYVVIAN